MIDYLGGWDAIEMGRFGKVKGAVCEFKVRWIFFCLEIDGSLRLGRSGTGGNR